WAPAAETIGSRAVLETKSTSCASACSLLYPAYLCSRPSSQLASRCTHATSYRSASMRGLAMRSSSSLAHMVSSSSVPWHWMLISSIHVKSHHLRSCEKRLRSTQTDLPSRRHSDMSTGTESRSWSKWHTGWKRWKSIRLNTTCGEPSVTRAASKYKEPTRRLTPANSVSSESSPESTPESTPASSRCCSSKRSMASP
ncbi:hypothetical protein B484DRAFT_179723, partial [Ochromonadaceae sp. CCMP2298]